MNFILLVIEWNPDPVIFQLGNISIKWYGIMYSLALLCCYALGYYFFKRDKLPLDRLLNLALLLFAGGIVGARLGQIIFYDMPYFINNPIEVFKIWEGGMASHGAFLMMTFIWYLYTKRNKKFRFWWGMDRLAIMGALIVSLMRLGNLMNSEIIGKSTSLSWAFIFSKRDLIPRHPVVVYEAVIYFIYFLLFFWIDYRYPKLKSGTLAALFLIVLVSTRMILEQFKEDAQLTQYLSVPLVIFGIAILFARVKLKNSEI